MTLVIPKASVANAWVDNWPATPSITGGTTVTPGTSGAEGAFAECIADTVVTDDIKFLKIWVLFTTAPVAPKNAFLDIAVDLAGGTTYATTLIDNIVCGSASTATTANQPRQWSFPINIPSSSSIACRIRGVSGTPGSARVFMRAYLRHSMPEWHPVGQFAETIGVTETTAVDATAFTPGNAADGTWASLGATTRDLWWWQLGYQVDNATITAEYTYIELGYGDGSSGGTTTILKQMHGGTTAETVGMVLQEQDISYACYYPLPAGTTMYVRGRCNNAPDTGYQAAAHAVGG